MDNQIEFSDEDRKQFEQWKATQKNKELALSLPSGITKIEVQAEKVESLPKKEKKPRTEKQIQALQKMREALLTKRKEHNEKKTEHTEQYKLKMQEAEEKADVIRELHPTAKVVVKSRVGRPKGRKNLPTDPTPYQSDAEEEEETEGSREPPRNKTLPPKPKENLPRMSALEMYLRKLNGF
jgi:hypothetical protein